MNIIKKENEHNSMKPKNLLWSILIDMEKDLGKKCSMSTLCYLKRLMRHKKSDVFRNKIALCKNELDTVEYMSAHKAMFSCYDAFIEKCFEKCTDCIKEQSE